MSASVPLPLLIASNRLPVTITAGEPGVTIADSSGGLVTGLKHWHDRGDGVWVGWPGDTADMSPEQRADIDASLRARRLAPVHLSRHEIDQYYHGFANSVLWPLFHYQVDRIPVDAADWDAYRLANERFAESIWREWRLGDTIWVHDYQLMLVPAMLRAKMPAARIGFFLHIPFPSSEVFRVLPWRREILQGLLGADLIGFHTAAYLRHFVSSLLHVDGVETDVDRVYVGGREVRLGVYPMGIDTSTFTTLAQRPDVVARAEEIRRDAGDRRVILGVDRLDYTKGIPRRLHALERLLAQDPGLADTIRYIQVAVPSRGEVGSYQRFKRQVEEFVGRINGAFGTVRSVPIHYVHHGVTQEELVALYRAADVMLVTPLRDGMNLVAKEFVASRCDDDGVLVLSEFAGAAVELDGAIVVNPYDVDGMAQSIRHALDVPARERRARMRTLRKQVLARDVHAWAAAFIDDLCRARPDSGPPARGVPGASLAEALDAACTAPRMRLLLDYDGTLVPLARSPEAARPDANLLELLRDLTRVPGLEIDIVSGRPREPLESWLGDLPIGMWAEHGFWRRSRPGQPWETIAGADFEWQDRIRPTLEQFVACTPGSHIEEKTASLAWHFRNAQRDHGLRQAHELRMLLGIACSNQPWIVTEGKKVIEVRLRAADKAVVGARVAAQVGPETALVAIGDERTDDDLFRSLPQSCVRIAVGQLSRHAAYTVADHQEVRRLLRRVLAARQAIVAS